MKRQNKFAIGYGILAVALAAVFALPVGSEVSNEANAFEIKDMFNVFSITPVQANDPRTHNITMNATALPDGRLGYQMDSHVIVESDNESVQDVTSRYDALPSIPGPTIIIEEGDEVFLTLNNELGDPDECVSVHVHGVHYAPESDGTLEKVNGVVDSCATVDAPKTFHWNAAKGSAGVWPYHDHTFGGELGSELEGLYGTLIVNQKKTTMLTDGKIKNISTDKIDKDFVLWMHGTSFWGMEIDHNNDGKQTPLWLNPTLKAQLGEKVRFNVLGIGSEFHTFHIHGHKWIQDGTTNVIDVQGIGPLTRTSFVIEAGEGVGPGNWMYHCHVFSHMEAGMKGVFEVTTDGAPSESGPSPFDGIVSFEIIDEPGPWFKNRSPIEVPGFSISESLALASPGDTLVFDMTSTNTVHTVTSLIYPLNTTDGSAQNMPFDQTDAFSGGANVQLEDEGLYVFTCKIHPYMFAAVIVDEDNSDGLYLGEYIQIVNGITTPTFSPLAVGLLSSFFTVTTPDFWQDYTVGTQTINLPEIPLILTGGAEAPLSVLNKTSALDLTDPQHQGIGEVWINTQFETSDGKTKYGSATAIDTSTWEVTKKVFGTGENAMNHPHNMWTNTENDMIYQTQWFDNKLSSIDRTSAIVLDTISVGDSPSHVMTRPLDGNTAYVALNGENSNHSVRAVILDSSGILTNNGTLNIGAPHPHGHWMNDDVMVTPNSFTGTSTIHEFGTGVNTIVASSDISAVDKLFGSESPFDVPIATGMHPSGEKYYVANLLDQTITCVSIGGDACVVDAGLEYTKPIPVIGNLLPDLLTEGLVSAVPSGAAGLLPIQTPVDPSGQYVVTATLLPSITIIDTETDELVLSIPCDAGCHGVNFGANVAGGYNAYVSSKFSNALIVFDPAEAVAADLDGNTLLNSTESVGIVGRVLLSTDNFATGALTDDTVNGFDGMGGQGILAIPNPYDGWIEETVALNGTGNLSTEVEGWINQLSVSQQDPYP